MLELMAVVLELMAVVLDKLSSELTTKNVYFVNIKIPDCSCLLLQQKHAPVEQESTQIKTIT
jgi:hypothetical protein